MIEVFREPVTTGQPPNPNELVYGDDGQVVTVNGIASTGFRKLLERNVMVTDLNCNFYELLDVGRFIPIPKPLIGTDDPRLSDARNMLPGSVFDISVAFPFSLDEPGSDIGRGGIQQSKLNLNGNIPLDWLTSPVSIVTTGDPINPDDPVLGDDGLDVTVGGNPTEADFVVTGALINPNEIVTGDNGSYVTIGFSVPEGSAHYAAQGDQAEYIAHKGQPNGYVPLDATGRMPLSMFPVGGGGGTLVHFGLDTSLAYFVVNPNVVDKGSGSMVGNWITVAGGSWFGSVTGTYPVFTNQPMPLSLIPGLDAKDIASGVFDEELLPVAVGVGSQHAAGAVPAPGLTGAPEDYLARDMGFHTMQAAPNYEPPVPDPSITILYYSGPDAIISVTDSLAGASLFYRVNHAGAFAAVPVSRPFPAPRGDVVEAYAAKIGYRNSNVVSLIVPLH